MWDLIQHWNLAIPPVSAVPSPVYISGSAASPLPQPSCRWVIRALECWRSLYLPVQDAQSPLGPWPHGHLQPLGMAPGDTSCRAVAMLWVSRLHSGKREGLAPALAVCPVLSCCTGSWWRCVQGMCHLDCSTGKWGTACAGLCIPPVCSPGSSSCVEG